MAARSTAVSRLRLFLSFPHLERTTRTHTHTHTQRERVFKRDKCHRPVTSVTLLGIVAVVTNDSANWCRYESCRWPPAPQPPADNVVGVVVIVVVLFPRSRRRHRAAGPERGDSSQGPASDSLPTPIITFQGSFFLFVFFFFFFFFLFFLRPASHLELVRIDRASNGGMEPAPLTVKASLRRESENRPQKKRSRRRDDLLSLRRRR